MPDGLDIDTKQPLNGTMAPYAEQVLICTGQDDWTSRIEEDEASDMARGLKELIGRGGKFSDPYHNVLITNSSFAPAAATTGSAKKTDASQEQGRGSAFLFPSFRFLPSIPLSGPGLESLVRRHILPTSLHPAHDVLSTSQRAALLRDKSPSSQTDLPWRRVSEAVVLICGHGGRDERCGVMGPLLRDEFGEKLAAAGYQLLDRVPPSDDASFPSGNDPVLAGKKEARVGLISHIGGHKYAGNVILYVPPDATGNPLAGCGVWYGRVRPEHVEGIVAETLGRGLIVKDLFRGGIGADGRPIML